jgi:hypothetical protein
MLSAGLKGYLCGEQPSGLLARPPAARVVMILYALVARAEVAAAAGTALLICCPLGPLALDRRRLARGSRRGHWPGPDGQSVADAHSS